MSHFCDTENWMAAYLDGRLAGGELREYETHLAECSRCRAELDAMRVELDEMGLGLAAREAIAGRAASAEGGERVGAAARFASRAARSLRVRPGTLAAAAGIAVVLVVAAFSILPRFVPSWDPDLRRGEASLRTILATTDLGELRLVGGAEHPIERAGRLRGAARPNDKTFARTEAAFQKTLVRHPGNYAAYDMLGDLYLAEGEADRAATAYRSALLIKPDDPALLNDLAVSLFRGGDLILSREYLGRAFAAVDAPPEICYNLAMVWRASGNQEEMKRYLRLYITKDRSSPWAAQAYRLLSE